MPADAAVNRENLSAGTNTDQEERLPRSTPETQGVGSAAILRFIAAARRLHELHCFIFVRHGHVIAEGYAAPYRADAVQLLNSLSKSFTATAVGFAVAEGRLAVDDRVVDFFPQQLPEQVSPNLQALTVEHLLTMSVGQASTPTDAIVPESDWIKAFLRLPIEYAPGSVFAYNSFAAYLLSAIVQKVSGQKLIDYLEPRLFAPLGILHKHWLSCPAGINAGGWGLSLTPESVAKFGQLYLQRGAWKGRQLLPQQWVDTASSFIQPSADRNVIAQDGETQAQAIARLKTSSDCYQGYGYQFWQCRHGAYRGDGAYGQFCIVVPHENAVIVITSCTLDTQGLLDNVWEHLLPAMHAEALPADSSSIQLQRNLVSMAIPTPKSPAHANASAQQTFVLENNSLGALRAFFDFRSDACAFKLEFASEATEVHCGIGQWIDNRIDMPGTPPRFISLGERRTVKVAAAARWKDANTLKMYWRYYETPNYDVVTCRFGGDSVTVEFKSDVIQQSASVAEDRPILRGRTVNLSSEKPRRKVR